MLKMKKYADFISESTSATKTGDPLLALIPAPKKSVQDQAKELAKSGEASVLGWQQKLNDAGMKIDVDGKWGTETNAAYIKYCTKRNL